jgi:hypothetical protein
MLATHVAHTPRIDLGRRRSTPEILRSALELDREYPWLFFSLAAAVMAPYLLAVLAVTGHGPLTRYHESFAERTLSSCSNTR